MHSAQLTIQATRNFTLCLLGLIFLRLLLILLVFVFVIFSIIFLVHFTNSLFFLDRFNLLY